MREILSELLSALEQGRSCAYCAVVETRGSTPQKAGAAMIVFADGSQRGTLGGGCVEAEVKQRALRVIGADEPRPEVLTFQLDDDYGWDDGLICGGRMTILADPLDGPGGGGRRRRAAEYFGLLRRLVERGSGGTEVVATAEGPGGVAAGDRYLFDADGRLIARHAAAEPPADLCSRLPPVQERPKPSHQAGLAFLPIPPRVTLLIVGGGHVGQAVARLAAELDFDVWVVDDRAAYASGERFPSASRLVAGEIGPALKELAGEVGPSTYALIVTRGHAHDEEALYHLAGSRAGYVGMIGSKRKIRLIFEDLRAKGIPEDDLKRVHAPLGLPIGSQTVLEIAVSIVAELIGRRNLGSGGALAGRPR